jgi:hypothetical protein
MKYFLAFLFILRNPVKIWSYGGWISAFWAASSKTLVSDLKLGVPGVIDSMLLEYEGT